MLQVTKTQLYKIIHAWGVDVKIPSKGKPTNVEFPDDDQYDFRYATVTKTENKSTDGLVLYSVEFRN